MSQEAMRRDRFASPMRPRPLTLANVAEATSLLQEGLRESECHPAHVVEACRRLLAAGSMMGVLLDRTDESGHDRVLGVGAGAFVSAGFVQSERSHPRPGLSERILQASLKGCPCTLNRREIEAANAAEGLRFAVLFHQWLHSEPEDVQSTVRRHLQSRFLDDLRGYNIVELISEGWTAEIPWVLSGGFRVRDGYEDWYREHDEPQPRRCLVGLSRDEARRAEGSAIAIVFDHTPARLNFTSPQRRLLTHALRHKTDLEIAEVLGVSLSAVKKTWAAIFDKASHLLPSLDDSDCAPGPRGARPTRGAQKRHILLTYLYEHPEELRP